VVGLSEIDKYKTDRSSTWILVDLQGLKLTTYAFSCLLVLNGGAWSHEII
jgi:hypothetical protein